MTAAATERTTRMIVLWPIIVICILAGTLPLWGIR